MVGVSGQMTFVYFYTMVLSAQSLVSCSQTIFCVCGGGGGKEKGLVNLVYHRGWPIPRFGDRTAQLLE